MPKGKTNAVDPLMLELDEDAYHYLEVQKPARLDAVRENVRQGKSASVIGRNVLRYGGTDRMSAICERAARHIQRTEA